MSGNKKAVILLSSILAASVVASAGIFFPETVLASAQKYRACSGEISSDGKTCLSGEISVCYEGFVPCGKTVFLDSEPDPNTGKCSSMGNPKYISCQLCHFFIMINGILKYILSTIIPPIAVLMIIIGGLMFYLSGGNPNILKKARAVLQGVIIGLFLIYGSYLIIGVVLSVLRVAEWTGLSQWAKLNPFEINCWVMLK